MKALFTNILNVFYHYKWATTLNLLGLSLAFTTCYVITRQAWYEFSFNHAIVDHEQIYQLKHYSPSSNSSGTTFVRPLLTQIFTNSPHIEAAGMLHFLVVNILASPQETPDKFYPTKMQKIDAGYTRVFGFEWLSGGIETFEKNENEVFIPGSLALKLYGSVDVTGKIIRSEDVGAKIRKESTEIFYTIAGVYRDFPINTLIDNTIYSYLGNNDVAAWGNGNYSGYIKLTSPDNQEALLKSITYPGDYFERWQFAYGDDFSDRLFPIDHTYFESTQSSDFTVKNPKQGNKTVTHTLLSIAGLILLIASINFINFSLALAPTRIRGINTQRVMGASVMSLRLTQLTEAIILSFLAFLISLIEIQLLSYTPLTDLFLVDIALTWETFPTVVLCGLTALLMGALAGIWPAVYTTSVPMAMALKGAFHLSPRGVRLRNLLIGFQFTSALILLTVAFFFFLQYRHLLSVPLGADTQQTVVINFNPYYITPDQQAAFTAKLESYAGAESATASDRPLFNPQGIYQEWNGIRVLIVQDNFVETLKIPILEGRSFESGEANKVLFNESTRQQNGFKIGDIFMNQYEVVGFIPDIKIFSLHETSSIPFGLFLRSGYNSTFYLKLKTGANEKEAIAFVQQATDEFSLFPGDVSVRMFSDVIVDRYENEQKQIKIIALFCGLILFISVMGVFGLVIFETQSRRKEIGICKINGASSRQIIWLFNRTYLLIVAICFAVSVPIARYIVQQWLEQFIDRIPVYSWVFGAVLLIIAGITAGTVSIQCWRAANANPVDSIKNE